jgi:hypothetical protein
MAKRAYNIQLIEEKDLHSLSSKEQFFYQTVKNISQNK